MASLNQVTLIGYLGDAPKVRFIQSDRKVASITVATTDKGFTTRDGKTIPDKTEWHNVTLWGRLADIAEKYLKQGSQVYVQGKLHTRSYEDKDKAKRYFTEIEAENLLMLDRKTNGQQNGNSPENTPQINANSYQTARNQNTEGAANIQRDPDALPF